MDYNQQVLTGNHRYNEYSPTPPSQLMLGPCLCVRRAEATLPALRTPLLQLQQQLLQIDCWSTAAADWTVLGQEAAVQTSSAGSYQHSLLHHF